MPASPSFSLFLLGLLPLVASQQQKGGPYTIRYYPDQHCASFSALACRNYPAFTCCSRPPASNIFVTAQVTSSGALGVVAFHTPSTNGQCAALSSTSSMNICLANSPFEPITVLGVEDVDNARKLGDTNLQQIGSIDMGDVSPIFGPISGRDAPYDGTDSSASTSGSTSDSNSNVAATSSVDYKCQGYGPVNALEHQEGAMFKIEPHHLTEEFVKDSMGGLSMADLVEKYKLELHPDNDNEDLWWNQAQATDLSSNQSAASQSSDTSGTTLKTVTSSGAVSTTNNPATTDSASSSV